MSSASIQGYEDAAAELIPRFEALAPEAVFSPVLDCFPASPCRVLDVGAGSGRNPAWLAAQGHRVTACEPVAAFRDAAAARYAELGIRWLADRLPMLDATRKLGESFDFVLLSGVWQHVEVDDRHAAMGTLATLMAPGARLIMSVRHGPGAPGRPVYGVTDDETIALAERHGLALGGLRHAPSIQAANKAAGVTWSWIAFEAR